MLFVRPHASDQWFIKLTIIKLIFFVITKVCCIHSNALKTHFITGANTMNPDQTAP